MAKLDSDVVGRLLQEVFSHQDGAKRLLEHLLNHTMQAEASKHVGAERHQRSVDMIETNGIYRKIVALLGGFEAALWDSFALFNLNDGSIAGAFGLIVLPTFTDPSLSWDSSTLHATGELTVVPEPATLSLLALGGLALIRKHKTIR